MFGIRKKTYHYVITVDPHAGNVVTIFWSFEPNKL